MNTNFDKLTRREKEVVDLVAQGLTNQEIADKLFISRRTAEIHRANAMRALGLPSLSDQLKKYLLLSDSERNEYHTKVELERCASQMYDLIKLFYERCKERPCPTNFELPMIKAECIIAQIDDKRDKSELSVDYLINRGK